MARISPTPHKLSPVEQFKGSILVQGSPQGMVVDDWPEGVDYLCGHCGRQVLARGVASDQVWDVAFECYDCAKLSVAHALPSGAALPAFRIHLKAGRHVIGEPHRLWRQALVGQGAVERRLLEAGAQGDTFGRSRTAPRPRLQGGPNELIVQIPELLGFRFEKLYAWDLRVRRLPKPPAYRHPLMLILEQLELSPGNLSPNMLALRNRRLIEFQALLNVVSRWEHHPLWQRIAIGLDSEFDHTLIYLSVAAWLEDSGNGIDFHAAPSGRAPDLRMVVGPQMPVAIEVKSPRALRDRTGELTAEEAHNIVRAAVRSAGTGKKGQLADKTSAILCVGGFHLSKKDLDQLEAVAARYLHSQTKGNRHRHIMAIVIASVVMVIRPLPRLDGGAFFVPHSAFDTRFVPNPGYSGGIPVVLKPPQITRLAAAIISEREPTWF